ncbi:antitermination protein [Kluyvera intermedia]|uniref:Antitermination protein n=1 Tax=Kluyvera intermedia TaxID=61648 RepID=A0ABX3UAJ1_KLUIN|nr:antitermination protein [Kluyvera intermedia]ORJ47985.1 antitermination protein [Kluyvera intermedia]
MNLESLPKFYSPKSPKLNDETPATSTDTLSITDVMAAQGMVQSKAPLGFSLFLAKVGISDPQIAIEGLMRYAQSLRNPVLMKLSDKARNEILPVLVQFAYADYSRSAASKSICPHCDGKGILRSRMDVVKHPGVKGVEPKIKNEQVEDICKQCDGKGVISTACRGCKGKGTVIDEKRTKLIGVPVMKVCGRCNGNRFSRVPTSLARVIVEKIVPDLTQYQWYSGYAEVIDKLVTKCWQEEAYAEAQLRKVTR